MKHRQRQHPAAQFAYAFLLTAIGFVVAAGIVARRFDHPDFRAGTR